MKTLTVKNSKSIRKRLGYVIFMLLGFTFSSYKGLACVASGTGLSVYSDTGKSCSLKAHFIDSIKAKGVVKFTSTSTGTGSLTRYSWNAGDGSGWKSGTKNFSHTYTKNGTYNAGLKIADSGTTCMDTIFKSVKITNADSAKAKGPQSNNTGDIQQSEVSTEHYTIYPNPNNGSFRMAMDGLASGQNAEIRISNLMGQLIYKDNEVITQDTQIIMPEAKNGIYFIQIIISDNSYTSRMVIQK